MSDDVSNLSHEYHSQQMHCYHHWAYVPLLVVSARLDGPEVPGRPPGKDKHPW